MEGAADVDDCSLAYLVSPSTVVDQMLTCLTVLAKRIVL